MRELYESMQASLLPKLKEQLNILENLPHAYDIEVGLHHNAIALEAWKRAYVLAKGLDFVEFETRRALYPFRGLFLYSVSIFIFLYAISSGEHKDQISSKFYYSLCLFIIMNAINCDYHLSIYSTEGQKYDFFAFKAYRNKVARAFEAVLLNNYALQKEEPVYPAMLTPTVARYFERNKQLKIGFPKEAREEMWDVNNRLFWHQITPYSQENTEKLHELLRLYQAYECFHSGSVLRTFSHLKTPFDDEYFQLLADTLMSQVLLLLSSHIIECSVAEQKSFYQLMGYCARHEPGSIEFYYASSRLKFPDREEMLVVGEEDGLNIQKSMALCCLNNTQREIIVCKLDSIFMSTISEHKKNKLECKRYNFFPPEYAGEDELSATPEFSQSH